VRPQQYLNTCIFGREFWKSFGCFLVGMLYADREI
jgi:hypothetical protein